MGLQAAVLLSVIFFAYAAAVAIVRPLTSYLHNVLEAAKVPAVLHAGIGRCVAAARVPHTSHITVRLPWRELLHRPDSAGRARRGQSTCPWHSEVTP